MSTRVVRSINDFLRHGMDVEVECRCGHKAVLDAHAVAARFAERGWSRSLEGACWLPSAHAHFRCSRCRRKGAAHVGPRGRG